MMQQPLANKRWIVSREPQGKKNFASHGRNAPRGATNRLKIRAEPVLPPVSPDDTVLLRNAASGDSKAFHALVDRHADRLYRLAASLVGNTTDAEDVLQLAFAGAYAGLSQFQARSSVKTWLTRILILQAAKWRRERRPASVEISAHDASASGEGHAGAVQIRLDMQAAMKQLSPEFREVLTLREFEGLGYQEIADLLDIPRGTVESRLHRARADLREKLKDYLP
jgi:RNA polymerase sigma-70 factor (ECF subfamily)